MISEFSSISLIAYFEDSSSKCRISGFRWKSTYTMIDKLLRMKDICVTLSIVPEESNIWPKMEELLTVLTSCKCITDLLQTEQLIINDVYKLWYNCILEISKIGMFRYFLISNTNTISSF